MFQASALPSILRIPERIGGLLRGLLNRLFEDEFVRMAFHTGLFLFICKVVAYISILFPIKDVAVRFTVVEVAISEQGEV
jgi:hypothetical protein